MLGVERLLAQLLAAVGVAAVRLVFARTALVELADFCSVVALVPLFDWVVGLAKLLLVVGVVAVVAFGAVFFLLDVLADYGFVFVAHFNFWLSFFI